MAWIKAISIGYFLCALQILGALDDNYFNQRQLRAAGIYNAYSLMQHGGFLCDLFLVIPIAAYITKKHQLAYASWQSLLIFVVSLVFVGIAGYVYNKVGDAIPVPYAHDGRTPFAGWIHGIFAVGGFWIMGMFYLTRTNPLPSKCELLTISSLFSVFFFLGIYDFSRKWIFYPPAKKQFAIELIVLWAVTLIRLKIG